MTRLLSVTSGRADIGILSPVWQALTDRAGIDLHVLATGMHMQAGAAPVRVPEGAVLHVAGVDLGGSDGRVAGNGMAGCLAAAATVIADHDIDLVLLVGDRLDMLPAACAALPFNLPMVHLHGGELTYGAVDDRVRHALSKMAHIHLASSVDAATRLAAMGEEPWRIHVTGGPGIDNLRLAPLVDRAAFLRTVGLPEGDGFILVTVHPETNAQDAAAPLVAVLEALDKQQRPTLITAPNSDPDGRRLQKLIDDFLPVRPWAVLRASLGRELYPSALRHAAVMLGNSSSGVVEAEYFGLPVVNVGSRQLGRPTGANVISVGNEASQVSAALAQALRMPRAVGGRLYGDGHAASRIADVLSSLPERARLLDKRHFQGEAQFVAPWH